MRYRRLGRTELQVSELSLGTVELGLNYGIAPDPAAGLPPPSVAEATRLLGWAVDAGINLIDTARTYGPSEEIIGQALQGHRAQVYLVTKVHGLDAQGNPLYGAALRQQMRHSVITSLRCLRTDWVDVLLLHSSSVPLLQAGEAVAVLKELQAEGLTRSVGASTSGLEVPRLALAQGVEVLQVAYNVLDQGLAAEIFPLAQAQDVGLMIRSVYLKGALTGQAEDLPAHLAPLKQRSRAFRRFVAGLTPPLGPAQAALRFVLARPDVTTALVGVRSEQELAEALSAATAGPLPAEAMAHLKTLDWADPLLDPGQWGIP